MLQCTAIHIFGCRLLTAGQTLHMLAGQVTMAGHVTMAANRRLRETRKARWKTHADMLRVPYVGSQNRDTWNS